MTSFVECFKRLKRKFTNPTTAQSDSEPAEPNPENENEQLPRDGRHAKKAQVQVQIQAHEHDRPPPQLSSRQMSGVKGDNNPSSSNPSNRAVNGVGSNSALRRPQEKIVSGKRSSATRPDSEEDRLLGSNHRDPNAVPIFPGRNRSAPGKQFEFKYGSSIGNQPNRKRNQGDHYRGAQNHRSDFGFGDVDGNENNGSPRKRQKNGMPKDGDWLSYEHSRTGAVPPFDSRPPSCAGSSNRGHVPHRQLFSSKDPVFQSNEYNDTEGTVQWRRSKRQRLSGPNVEDDEAFTAGSKARREEDRTKEKHEAIDVENLGSPTHKGGALLHVEIPTGKSSQTANRDDGRLADKFVSTDGQRRNRDPDSPDVLQGGATVSGSWKANGRRSPSPGNIPKTDFTSSKKTIRPSGKAGNKQKSRPSASFPIVMFHSGPTVIEQPCELVAEEGGSSVFYPSESPTAVFDIRKADRISWGRDPSTKVSISFPNTDPPTATVDVAFASPKASADFCRLAETYAAKINDKEADWMDKLFGKQERHSRFFSKKSPTVELDAPQHQNKPLKRQRIVEQLDGHASVERQGSPQATSISERQSNQLPSHQRLTHGHPSPDRGDDGIRIPVKKYDGNSMRETRSTRQQQTMHIDSDRESETPLSPIRRKASGWSKPLVYPRIGKKKAEVESHDLERLHDSEFLNDNLIGFYLRFLEHHLERTSPDLAKRVYFFNSYFFASLTNTARGKKGINYEAVKKWTRAVNIFEFDYVVVPINENAHWYIVIICNLPSLLKPEAEEGESGDDKKHSQSVRDGDETKDDARDVDERDNPAASCPGSAGSNHERQNSENGKDEQLRGSFGSMTLSDPELKKKSAAEGQAGTVSSAVDADPEKDDWPDEDENRKAPWSGFKQSSQTAQQGSHHSTPSPSKKPKPRSSKKKNRPSLQKYETDQPTIITFDSLGCSRFPTIRILKDYLKEEGESKLGLQIDIDRIKGMTAKEIPQQPNYWDCGLYLLAYMEKFVRDPDEFIRKLLRREMSGAIDWPPMKSKILRRRLRNFLFELYDEQDKTEEELEGKKLMVDAKPLRILLREEENKATEQTKLSNLDKVGSESKRDGGQQWPVLEEPRTPRRNRFEQTPPPRAQVPHGRQTEPEPQSNEQRPTTPKLHKSPGTPARERAETRSSPRHQRKEKKRRTSSVDDDIVDKVLEVVQNQNPLLDGIHDFADVSDSKPRSAGKKESVVEIPGTPPPRLENAGAPDVVETSPKGSLLTPSKKTGQSGKDVQVVV